MSHKIRIYTGLTLNVKLTNAAIIAWNTPYINCPITVKFTMLRTMLITVRTRFVQTAK